MAKQSHAGILLRKAKLYSNKTNFFPFISPLLKHDSRLTEMAIHLCSVLVEQSQSTGSRDSEVLEQDLWWAAMVRELQDRTGMERLREQPT